MAGNFVNVDSRYRARLVVLEMNGQARVSNWNTDVFHFDCPGGITAQYIKGIDIAPDNTYFLAATTGFWTRFEPTCDTATTWTAAEARQAWQADLVRRLASVWPRSIRATVRRCASGGLIATRVVPEPSR